MDSARGKFGIRLCFLVGVWKLVTGGLILCCPVNCLVYWLTGRLHDVDEEVGIRDSRAGRGLMSRRLAKAERFGDVRTRKFVDARPLDALLG